MLVRFTTKKHGPVAVANVDDAKVELSPDLLSFSARGRGKPLVFELRLRLEQRILPAASSWSFEVTLTRTLALTLTVTLTVTLTLTLPNPNPHSNQGRGQLTLHLVKELNASWSQLCPPAEVTNPNPNPNPNPNQVDEDLRALPVRRCVEEPPEQVRVRVSVRV